MTAYCYVVRAENFGIIPLRPVGLFANMQVAAIVSSFPFSDLSFFYSQLC